ncbi:MAG: NAD(P)/FAD-dependent oxidoreductase [bacterium]
MNDKHTDIIVIGGGTAGLNVARNANARGMTVRVIEATKPGGDCLWWTCLPTKLLLESAGILKTATDAGNYGIFCEVIGFDYASINARKTRILADLANNCSPEKLADEGILFTKGKAKFIDSHTIGVGADSFTADYIVISVGAHPTFPPIPGLMDIKPITYMHAISQPKLPESITIIGGGAVGCEFALIYARFGVKVVLLEIANRLLPMEDADCGIAAADILTKAGVKVETAANILRVESAENGKAVVVYKDGIEETIIANEILVATGRRPRLDGMNVEAAGLSVERGKLQVDESLRTIIPHIFVCGDATGGRYQFYSTAEAEGRHVGINIGNENTVKFSDSIVPRATYLSPELAGVGMTEDQCKDMEGIAVAKVSYSSCDRAAISGEIEGFVKLVANINTGKILGGFVAGPHASMLVQEIALIIKTGISIGDIADMMQVYPSYHDPLRDCARLLLLN